MLSPVEIASVTAAIIAAFAAVWQGMLTRLAINASMSTALAQERLNRLTDLFSALQEAKSIAIRAEKRGIDALRDDEALSVIQSIDAVRSSSIKLAMALEPTTFGTLFGEIADFVVWVAEKKPTPAGESVLGYMHKTAGALAGKVYELSQQLNSLGKK